MLNKKYIYGLLLILTMYTTAGAQMIEPTIDFNSPREYYIEGIIVIRVRSLRN